MKPLGELQRTVMYAILRNREDAYGVTIADTIEEFTGREPAMGAVYNVLDRLEKMGYVRSEWSEPKAERGGRRKRLYEVTGLGEQALREFESLQQRMTAGWTPVGEGA